MRHELDDAARHAAHRAFWEGVPPLGHRPTVAHRRGPALKHRLDNALAAYLAALATNPPLDFIKAQPVNTVIPAALVPGEPRKVAYNALTYSVRAGLTERVGQGLYRRIHG